MKNNNLHNNIELLKKINRIRDFQTPYLKELLGMIGSVKNTRNLFVHGTWTKPIEFENDVVAHCKEQKIQYSEEKDKQGQVVSKKWQHSNHTEIRLTYVIQQIKKIDDIIFAQESMLKKVDKEQFR